MRRKPFSFTSSLHGLNEKEAATKCTSLTTIFLRTPIFGCVAPPMPFRSRIGIVLFLIRMFNQLQSITIHWLPIRPEHTKVKMLLISRREHHNSPTVFKRVDDSLHNFSRTRALICPTKTPGDISSSHLLTSPRNPEGHAVRTMTIMAPHSTRLRAHHHQSGHRLFLQEPPSASHPTGQHDSRIPQFHRTKRLTARVYPSPYGS